MPSALHSRLRFAPGEVRMESRADGSLIGSVNYCSGLAERKGWRNWERWRATLLTRRAWDGSAWKLWARRCTLALRWSTGGRSSSPTCR